MDKREINPMITQEDAQNKVARKKSHDGGQTDRHSTGRPKIKRACAKKEAPGRSSLYSKRQEPQEEGRMTEDQTDRYSTGRPEIKWACAQEVPRRGPLCNKGRN